MGMDVNFPFPCQVHIDVTYSEQGSVYESYDLKGNYSEPGNLV